MYAYQAQEVTRRILEFSRKI